MVDVMLDNGVLLDNLFDGDTATNRVERNRTCSVEEGKQTFVAVLAYF
jgi:hypothetical protein